MVQKNSNPPHKAAIRALEAFSRHGVPYLIVGGAALALHGIPRTTLDVDIVIPAETQAIIKVFRVAKLIGLKNRQAKILTLAEKPNLVTGQWVSFEDRRKRQLIDVFFEKEKQFQKLYSRSVERKGRKITFHVASLSDIEKMKKASGRPIDLADVALIREVKKIRRSTSKHS